MKIKLLILLALGLSGCLASDDGGTRGSGAGEIVLETFAVYLIAGTEIQFEKKEMPEEDGFNKEDPLPTAVMHPGTVFTNYAKLCIEGLGFHSEKELEDFQFDAFSVIVEENENAFVENIELPETFEPIKVKIDLSNECKNGFSIITQGSGPGCDKKLSITTGNFHLDPVRNEIGIGLQYIIEEANNNCYIGKEMPLKGSDAGEFSKASG